MQVDAAVGGRVEHRPWEDASVGHDHGDVGAARGDPVGKLAGLDLDGLVDVEAELASSDLDRGFTQAESATSRPVRLADNACHRGALRERPERRDSHCRRAKKDGAHSWRYSQQSGASPALALGFRWLA